MNELLGFGLVGKERQEALDITNRFSVADQQNVLKVIELFNNVAEEYFNSPYTSDLSGFYRTGKDWYENHDAPRGYQFFAVYLIGGNITKKGDRPDIDLLTVTNMRYADGYGFIYDHEEWFQKRITEFFQGQGSVACSSPLPSDYNIGHVDGKALFTVTPNIGKRIDINYVRSFYCDQQHFGSEEDFFRLDVDSEGKPLPRLPLYVRKSDAPLSPQFKWSLGESEEESGNQGRSSVRGGNIF